MSALSQSVRDNYCVSAIHNKFGDLLDWEIPDIKDIVGPFEPEIFLEFNNRRLLLIADCQREFLLQDDIDLPVISDQESPDDEDKRKLWWEYRRKEIDILRSDIPPWFAAGFGHHDYEADFEYWSQSRYFSHAEALCLSLGIEPKHFEEKQLVFLEERAKKTELWAPLHYMVKRREQLSRQFSQAVYKRGVEPKELFKWIELVQLKIHPRFTSRYLVAKESFKQNSIKEKSYKTDQREIDSIAQLFAAIAIEELGYVPDAPRSPIPKEIAEFAATMGLNISDDTVRKYLKRGASFLPSDWKSK